MSQDYPTVLEKQILVCANQRPPGHPRGCCGAYGGPQVRDAFTMKILENGLQGRVRATMTGCMDQCELGCVVVVYPDDVWYKGVRPEDVEEIFREHILEGRPVDRFRIASEDLDWAMRSRQEGRVLRPRPVPYEE